MQTFLKSQWFFYLRWFLTGAAALVISFAISLLLAVFVINDVFGDMIMVRGEWRITEDYVLGYPFIVVFGLVIGFLQALMLREKFPHLRGWVVASLPGWALAWFFLAYANQPLGDFDLPTSPGWVVLYGIAAGLLTVGLQWLVLRGWLPRAGWWVPANILAFTSAALLLLIMVHFLQLFATASLPALATGLLLWFLEQNKTPLRSPVPQA